MFVDVHISTCRAFSLFSVLEFGVWRLEGARARFYYGLGVQVRNEKEKKRKRKKGNRCKIVSFANSQNYVVLYAPCNLFNPFSQCNPLFCLICLICFIALSFSRFIALHIHQSYSTPDNILHLHPNTIPRRIVINHDTAYM